MPTKLSISAESRGGIKILLVSGEIDLSTASRLGQTLEQALDPGAPLIADLAEVTFIDSAGARALALAERAATALGADLLIVPSEFVSRVLSLAGLEPVFRLYAESAEAVGAAREIVAHRA